MTDYRSLELSIREKAALYISAFTAFTVTGWLFYDSFSWGIIFVPLIFKVKAMYAEALNKKKKEKLILQFKDLMYSVSSYVSSGRSLGQSLEESIYFWKGTYDERDYIIKELKFMVKRMNESMERDIDLLKNFAERSGLEDIRDFVTACDICKRTGGNFASAVCRCTDIIGDKISLEKELNTAAAQKRFESRVVGIAPFAIIFFIKLTSPEYLYPLSHTQTGRAVSTVALLMIGYGWVIIERMNRIEF